MDDSPDSYHIPAIITLIELSIFRFFLVYTIIIYSGGLNSTFKIELWFFLCKHNNNPFKFKLTIKYNDTTKRFLILYMINIQ